MSALAQIADARTVAPELHVVEATGPSAAALQVKEMNRWMLWFGTPLLVMSFFMGVTFVTGQIWGIAAVLAALIVDICILIWLCMSSDTNGASTVELAAAH
jgi:hypothetical protein